MYMYMYTNMVRQDHIRILKKKKVGPGGTKMRRQAFTFFDFEVPSSVHFFRFWNSVIEKQKKPPEKLDPKMPRALFCVFALSCAENGLFRIEFFQAAFFVFQLRCSKIEKSERLTAPRNLKK